MAELDVDAARPGERPGRPGLTIAEIETIAIRVPLARTYHGSAYKMTHRSTIITRIRTEEGIVGEAYCGDEDAGLHEIDAIIRTEIAPRLIGEDAFRVERCWELARPATFDILRDRRLGLVATACVDAAIWDAIGKALGQPLHRLWGGYRDSLPVITIGGYYGKQDIADEVAELRERGLAGHEVQGRRADARGGRGALPRPRARPPGPTSSSAPTPTRPGRPPRRSASPGSSRISTCTGSRSRASGRTTGARCATFASRGGVRVCAGQSEFSAGGCRDLMVEGAIDFCNFDSSWSGGATEWRRVAAAAVAFDVAMAHHEEPQIATHLLASIPHGTFLEVFSAERDPIWWNLVANRSPIVDGSMALPTAPGLGWELDADYIEAYRVSPRS